jgi:phosphoglycolate phosphatase
MLNIDIRAVIFDFDSTLAETHIDFGEMRRRIVEHLERWAVWTESEGDTRWVLELVDHGAARLPLPADRERFLAEAEAHLQDVEVAGCTDARVYPGTLEALAALHARDIRIGIVTRNCRRCVEPVLRHHRLPHDVLLTRDDAPHVKPDPRHLTAALEILGVAPEHTLMVGDHPTDVECGLAAGALTAGVLTGKTTREEFGASGAHMVGADVAEVVRRVLASV